MSCKIGVHPFRQNWCTQIWSFDRRRGHYFMSSASQNPKYIASQSDLAAFSHICRYHMPAYAARTLAYVDRDMWISLFIWTIRQKGFKYVPLTCTRRYLLLPGPLSLPIHALSSVIGASRRVCAVPAPLGTDHSIARSLCSAEGGNVGRSAWATFVESPHPLGGFRG